MDVLAEAQATMKLTAIMVHHDMQLALEYANRVAVIKEGQKVLEIGKSRGKVGGIHVVEPNFDELEKNKRKTTAIAFNLLVVIYTSLPL